MADTTKGNGLKIIAIIAGSLTGIWVLGRLITGKWNPVKWFSKSSSPSPDYTLDPTDCNPRNIGFQVNGVRNPQCGNPSQFECDPNRD